MNMKHTFGMIIWSFSLLTFLFGEGEAEANYRKKTIAVSGQIAPGTGGATFSSSIPPSAIGLAESGKLLFRAYLEGAAVTFENDEGLWVAEADTLRLLAREGGAVPGLAGMFFINNGLPMAYMDPSGQIGLDAVYSPDGTNVGSVHGFLPLRLLRG